MGDMDYVRTVVPACNARSIVQRSLVLAVVFLLVAATGLRAWPGWTHEEMIRRALSDVRTAEQLALVIACTIASTTLGAAREPTSMRCAHTIRRSRRPAGRF